MKLEKVLIFIGLCLAQISCSILSDIEEPDPQMSGYLPSLSESITPTSWVNTATATPIIEISSTPTINITPSPSQAPKTSLYQFEVRFDVDNKVLEVIEEISYLNQTGFPLEDIALNVPPNHRPGQFILKSLTSTSDPTSLGYELNEQRLSVNLSSPLKPMETLILKLEYTLNIPSGGGILGYTDRQINVCDWYPFIPPYQQDSGWIIHPYSTIGEYLVADVADFEVKISPLSSDPSLIIAAGGSGEKIGNSYYFTLPEARSFAWSASREYQILRQAENTTVVAYVLPEHIDVGWRALAASISAFNLYSSLFGVYPHQTLSLVEGDFSDGMEFDGLFFVGVDYFSKYSGGEKNYLTLISAHETAHQWWFACVGNDPAREPWLDEALATYSELFFYEVYYPGDEEWWWNFRVHHYAPSGWVDQTVYNFGDTRHYINAIYLNGALFIDQIRQSIGTEAFRSFLAEYCRIGSGKIMTNQDFFDLLNSFSTADLTPIIESYFHNK